MEDLKPGQLVRSKAGRDQGKHYLVLEVAGPRQVLLVNGRSRPLDHPKRKNVAHVQRYQRWADLEALRSAGRLTDSEIIATLRELLSGEEAP